MQNNTRFEMRPPNKKMTTAIELGSEFPIEEILAATPFTRKEITKYIDEQSERGFTWLTRAYKYKNFIAVHFGARFYKGVFVVVTFHNNGGSPMVYYNSEAAYNLVYTWNDFSARYPNYLVELCAARKKLAAPFIAEVTAALPQPIAEEMEDEIYVPF